MKKNSFATLSIALLSCSLLCGCDTSARISFQDPSFDGLRSTGVTLPEKDAMGTETSKLVSRFVLFDTEGGVVTDGSIVGRARVKPSSVKVAFSSNDFEQYAACTACGTSFSCQSGSAVCSATAGLSTGTSSTPKFLSHNDQDKVIGVLLQASASVRGQLPNAYRTGKFCAPGGCGTSDQDVIRDGNGANQVAAGVLADKINVNKEGGLTNSARSLVETVKKIAASVDDLFDKGTYVGFYRFNSEKGLTSLGSRKQTALLKGEDAAKGLAAISACPRTEDCVGSNDVFKAIEKLLKSDTTEVPPLTSQKGDRVLIVFVDGPDSFRTDPAQAIKVAKDEKVRIFIVHFDVPLPQKESNGGQYKYYPDLPDYYKGQLAACVSDDNCYHFERCVEPQRYVDGSVEFGGVNAGKKCIVKRDELGQTGPIDTYAQLTAATGGGYIYVPNFPVNINQEAILSWLPWTSVGLWETPVSFTTPSTLENGRYKVANGSMTVSLLGVKDPATGAPPEQMTSFKSGSATRGVDSVSPVFVVSPSKQKQTP